MTSIIAITVITSKVTVAKIIPNIAVAILTVPISIKAPATIAESLADTRKSFILSQKYL